ncbi:MAG: hypothetical protein CG437_8 [Methanosaeta sp. NSP1]|nr:MAG: hypothetical protein CG437_8 [Methanosaeta sp. NSP1]
MHIVRKGKRHDGICDEDGHRQSRLTEKLMLARKMWRIIMIQKAEGSAYKNLGIRNSLVIRETIQAILPSKEVSKPPFE